MKLLIDQGLPRSTAALLRDIGIDTLHVGEIDMTTAADADILARGHAEKRTVVTLDADFHAILALSGANSPSVIRLRIEGLKAKELMDLLQRVLRGCSNELASGALVTVQESSMRIRRLPLIDQSQ